MAAPALFDIPIDIRVRPRRGGGPVPVADIESFLATQAMVSQWARVAEEGDGVGYRGTLRLLAPSAGEAELLAGRWMAAFMLRWRRVDTRLLQLSRGDLLERTTRGRAGPGR